MAVVANTLPAVDAKHATMVRQQQQQKKRVTPFTHFVAGWIGASAACVLLSPLEVLKTRMQSAAGAAARMGPLSLTSQIFRAEGFAGFYRGLLPHLLGVGPSRAFYFGAYNGLKTRLGQTDSPLHLHGTSLHLTSAAIASIVSATIMSPVWVVKTRLQLQDTPSENPWVKLKRLFSSSRVIVGETGHIAAAGLSPALGAVSAATSAAHASASGAHVPYKGIADAFVRVYREEGFRAFYRGLGASYLGVVETAFQFAVYGALKEHVLAGKIDEAKKAIARGERPKASDADLRRAEYSDAVAFSTSAAAKLVAAVATYPHEVLRTRLREQRGTGAGARYSGVIHAMRSIYAEEGLRGLYGGMSVHLLRTVPNAAILLMVVERMVGGEV